MLQFSKRLAPKGLKVTLIITPSIAKSMQGQYSSINLEPIFDGSCHNPILGYSSKNFFFQNKNKKNKIKAGNVEKAGWGIKL